MKNIKILLIALILVFSTSFIVQADSQKVKVVINDEELALDKPAVIEKGVILIPAKSFVYKINLYSDVINKGNDKFLLLFNSKYNVGTFLDSPLAFSMDLSKPTDEFPVRYYKMKAVPKMINGMIYIPIESICEGLGYKYKYENGTVSITVDGTPDRDFMATIKEWSGEDTADFYFEIFNDEYLSAIQNLIVYLSEYKLIGKDVWLNKPEYNKYSNAVMDLNGNPVVLKNLEKFKIVDIAFTKLNESTDEDL